MHAERINWVICPAFELKHKTKEVKIHFVPRSEINSVIQVYSYMAGTMLLQTLPKLRETLDISDDN